MKQLADIFCTTCGNEGKEGGCPKCGKEVKPLYDGKSEEVVAKTIGFLENVIKVPEEYLGNRFTKQVLLDDNRSNMNEDLRTYADNLERYLEIFKNGGLPKRSTMVMSPTGYAKKVLAYSCIEIANDNRFSVSPLLSTIDIAFIMRQAADFNPNFKFNGVGYMDLYYLDFMVVQVAHTDFKYDSYKILQELLNMRSRMNKTTLILSDFGLNIISDWDDQQNFVRLFQAGYMDNKKLYPSIIEYQRR